MSDFEIRYTRQKPEEWDILVDAIAPIDEPFERPVSTELAAHALRKASTLETEQLESATYYGLGLGMRGLAKALHGSESRHKIAARIASKLTASHKQMRDIIANPGPAAFNTFTQASLEDIMHLGVQTYQALPIREHLAADALTIATRARRDDFNLFQLPDGRKNPVHTQNVRGGKAAATLIVSNATAGSIIVHHHQRAARALVTNEQKDQNPLRFAVQSASLHTEEFQGSLYQGAVTYGADGTVALDRLKIPTSPELPKDRVTNIKHVGRLVCPAVQVQHAIPGMLELILDVERAQER